MKKLIYSFLLTSVLSFQAFAQVSIENILLEIEKNNKTLQANAQNTEAQKLAFKSSNPLYNPNMEYDFMYGFPLNAGNQTDFLVNQAFDFPTSYSKRKQLAEGRISQSDLQYNAGRQEVLLEAQQTCLELVYRNKLQIQLQERKAYTEGLLESFEKKLNTGEGNILDVNKAKLQLIEINKDYQLNLSQINQLTQKLTGLNGGNDIIFLSTQYPTIDSIGDFEELYAEIQSKDPTLKFIEMDISSAQKQVELSKAMALPKLEAGYRHQAILGQRFNGFHLGTSIPLWENKYKVRQSEAELSTSSLKVLQYQNDKYASSRQLFEKYEKLSLTLNEYKTVLSALNSKEYLDKALAVGHISTIEYFLESNYYYMAYNNYLQTEFEYYATIAEILKFRL
ncbi:TolC family protein [Aquiflexum gelatinilyticum]|uniref:TolC family protein n=1 Tax=Aquiflexum gelatinilyticum TaxID=2961943 RepID=A0A9X2T0Y0_9BACT|nr:TolC family protein [Aquiflexum gelatinilyticum]MCR9015291.1 TolC family protein [Aquiflexum gelatinilyticum]